MEERDELLKEINNLKEELENAKTNVVMMAPPSDSLLRGEDTKDIISKSFAVFFHYCDKPQEKALDLSVSIKTNSSYRRLKLQD
jgi:hypothetical protein